MTQEQFMEDDPKRLELRARFDKAAEDYQRSRPVCPPQPQARPSRGRPLALGPSDHCGHLLPARTGARLT